MEYSWKTEFATIGRSPSCFLHKLRVGINGNRPEEFDGLLCEQSQPLADRLKGSGFLTGSRGLLGTAVWFPA